MSSKLSRFAALLLAAAVLPASDCSGDTGGGQTIDRLTIRLSVSITQAQALGHSVLATPPAGFTPGQLCSRDGRFVAFESLASNLTTDDANTVRDIFVKDRLTGAVDRVSVKTSGPIFPGIPDPVQPSFTPVTIDGNAAGKITRNGIITPGVPNVRAARKKIGGIFRIPSAVAIAIAGAALITITK